MQSIRAEFEAWIAARGRDARDALFGRLLLADPALVLAVGLDQYAKRGNGDRLQLAADLLSAAGRRAYPALLVLAKSYRPELIYFVDLIASSHDLSVTERADLLVQIRRAANTDQELLEKLDSVVGWLPPDTQDEIRRRCDFDPAFAG